MAKRTGRDELISQRIYKNRKEAEEKAGIERLKIPIPRLSKEDVYAIIGAIENFVVQEFSKDDSRIHVSFSACRFLNNESIHEVFHFVPYLSWVLDYSALLCQNTVDHHYQKFAREWIKKETVHFLDLILTTWNNLHGTYVMSWTDESPFEISIKKID